MQLNEDPKNQTRVKVKTVGTYWLQTDVHHRRVDKQYHKYTNQLYVELLTLYSLLNKKS